MTIKEIQRNSTHKLLMVERYDIGVYYQVVNLSNFIIEMQTPEYYEAKNYFYSQEWQKTIV